MIKGAEVISSLHTLFYNVLSNIKLTFINKSFTNNIFDEKIKLAFKVFRSNTTEKSLPRKAGNGIEHKQ